MSTEADHDAGKGITLSADKQPAFWDEPELYDVCVDGVVQKMFLNYRGALEFFYELKPPFDKAAIVNRGGQEMVVMLGHPIRVRTVDSKES